MLARGLLPMVLGLLVGAESSFAAEPKTYEIKTHSDLKYRADTGNIQDRNVLDVYEPQGVKDAPVLFLVHGGTWQHGSKDYFLLVAQAFAKKGIVVVCPNYRLSPKVKHPEHIKDVAKAFTWVVENVAKYGGNSKKIVVAGHSAGGHLASLLAVDEQYLKAEKLTTASIKGVIGVSGVYSIPPVVFNSIFGSEVKECQAASPIHHVKKDLPPSVLIYGDKDLPFLDSMAKDMCKALVGAKCDAETCEIKNRNHINVMYDASKTNDPVFEKMEAAIRKWTK